MITLSIEELRLDLKFSWKISRGSTDFKINFLIKITNGLDVGLGEVAPNVRYGETPDLIKKQFDEVKTGFHNIIESLHEFNECINSKKICNSLRFGIESAFIHFYCNKNKIDFFKLFDIQKPGLINTAFSLPIMEANEMLNFYKEFNLNRFKFLKIKVDKQNAFEAIKTISGFTDKPLMIDANEAWDNVDDLLNIFQKIKKFNILLIEQPLPSIMKDEYRYLFKNSPYEIIGDESITDNPNFEELKNMFHGVNMKLMKAGGYQNGINIIKGCIKNNIKPMIGCMIESTLGISSALKLSYNVTYIDLDSFLYIKNEPFQLINEESGLISNI